MMAETARYEILHISQYHYPETAWGCVMTLCLRPRHDAAQRLLRFDLTTVPSAPLDPGTDSFGNVKHVLNIHRPHRALEVVSVSVVETEAPSPPMAPHQASWEEIHSWRDSFSYWDFLQPSALTRPSTALDRFVHRMEIRRSDDPLESLRQLSDRLHHGLRYLPGSTSVASPVDDILATGEGVCQDYAHLMIAVTRSWGLPTRYVSGYVATEPGALEQASSSHAWVECLLPRLGWVGFDPTNGRPAGSDHVRVAVGRDYQDVAPTRGVVLGGGAGTLDVAVRMVPVAAAGGARPTPSDPPGNAAAHPMP